jgi:hypothetical protein
VHGSCAGRGKAGRPRVGDRRQRRGAERATTKAEADVRLTASGLDALMLRLFAVALLDRPVDRTKPAGERLLAGGGLDPDPPARPRSEAANRHDKLSAQYRRLFALWLALG